MGAAGAWTPSLLATYGACERTPSWRWRATDQKEQPLPTLPDDPEYPKTVVTTGALERCVVITVLITLITLIWSALRDGAVHAVL